MTQVYVAGKSIRLNPSKIIGEGGEAEVYDIRDALNSSALKLWKTEDHADYIGQDEQAKRNRAAAKTRIAEYQHKLPNFPKGLPQSVITPHILATNRSGDRILGYSMQLLDGAEALRQYAMLKFRERHGYTNDHILKIFRVLHKVVADLHKKRIVIGDFNYLNVLIKACEAYLIDADSFQFGKFFCKAFTTRFVDPLICDPTQTTLVQHAPHSENTDWYAYAVMLFECLTLVHPYGGVYEPKGSIKQVPWDTRPLKRISVLHKDVLYPHKGIALNLFPDDFLHLFTEILGKDKRGEFPFRMLENMRWTRCTKCGAEHARALCPSCGLSVPRIAQKAIIRGRLTDARHFETSGRIVHACVQDGMLKFLYYHDGALKREDGSTVVQGAVYPEMKFRISGSSSLVAMQGHLLKFKRPLQALPGIVSNQAPEHQSVESFRGLRPSFDANLDHVYWISQGRLLRDADLGPMHIGDVLPEQTRIWAGSKFGFGFYRAGSLKVGFVFDAEKAGINDQVKLPPISGEILDATCYFTDSRAWFLFSAQESGKVVNRCLVIKANGQIVASYEAQEGDGSWLSEIHGKCAADLAQQGRAVHVLFAATDKGLVRVEEDAGQILQAASFPDTQGSVGPSDHILLGKEGIFVVRAREIRLLTFRK